MDNTRKRAQPFWNKQARYLELVLHKQKNPGLPGLSKSESMLDILRVIKKAQGDPGIRGLALNAAGCSLDREGLWELRTALQDFKARGKKIAAYFDNADFNLYLLISLADTIVMDQGGSLSLLGYVQGRGYIKHTLEKLGIGVRELRYLDYKSAMETYTRDSLSEADRLQYEAYLGDIFGLARDTLLEARSWQGEDLDRILNREFLYSPEAAQAQGLVDRIGREEALIQGIEELEGQGIKGSYLYGSPRFSLLQQGKAHNRNYSAAHGRNTLGRGVEIALINAAGATELDRGMGARKVSKTIRELSEKAAVRALVIRINSPGGSAIGADYVAEAIRSAKKKKPVVVSMGAVAASGGYWAALYASHILASPYTLTGSIGVIAGWFYDRGLYDRVGCGVDTLSRGEHADLGTGMLIPRRDLTPLEEERYRRYILDLYRVFVGKVAEARGMSSEAVEALAQGRVYSGLAAQRLGLVDSIGGLSEALGIARNLAEIPEKQRVLYREYPKPTLSETLVGKLYSFFSLKEMSLFLAPEQAQVLKELGYRLSLNGRAMPLLPVDPWFSLLS